MHFTLPLLAGGALGSALLALSSGAPISGAPVSAATSPALERGPADAAASAPAAEAPAPAVRVLREVRFPLRDVPLFGDGEAVLVVFEADERAPTLAGGLGPSMPTGDNGLGQAGICCDTQCPPQPGVYGVGDRVAINYTWFESLPADLTGDWFVDLTAVITGPGGKSLVLFDDPALNLGSFPAGVTLGSCFSFIGTVPPGVAGTGLVEQSFSVFSLQGGFGRTPVANLIVN